VGYRKMLEESAVDFLTRLLRESLQDRGDLIFLENMRKSILGLPSDPVARERFSVDVSATWDSRGFDALESKSMEAYKSLNGAPALRPKNYSLLAYCAEIIRFLQNDRAREDDFLRSGHIGYVSQFSAEEIQRFATLYMAASSIFRLGGDL